MANGTNVGNVELKVTLNKENITQELLKTFENCQSQADKNTITYKIAGDKTDLEAKLKQIQSTNPELLAKLRLDFDKSDYDKEMNTLKNTSGKTAKQIGEEFKSTVENSLKDFNISQIIGKKLGKNDLLNTKDVGKIKDVIQSLRQQTEGFDLSKVTSTKAINDQVIALSKIDVLLSALSNHTNQKSIKIDGNAFDIAQMLQQNTSSIENIMQNVGSVIHTNASKWMTDLENTFNTEYGSILSILDNLAKGVQGVLGGTTPGGSSGGGTSQALDDLKKQLKDVDEQIKNTEASIERLNKLKNESFRDKSQRQNLLNNKNNEIYDFYGKNESVLGSISDDPELIKEHTDIINNFKTLMQEYIDLGGKFSELKAFKAVEPAKVLGLSEKDFSAEGISKQIEVLTENLNNLNKLKEDLNAKNQTSSKSEQPPSTDSESKNGTPTNATVSPQLSEDFKTKLQEQVTNIGSVDATISGKLSETFKEDVQTNVTNLGTVNMGVSFTNQNKEGENKQEIPVDVIATPKLSDTFRDDLQKKVDDLGSYEVKINLKDANKDNNTDGNDEPTLINVKPNNIEDFKSQLKSGVEGEAGLDIKVNPVVVEDFNLEIKNATLKDVKVEGDINGGNLKPSTVETPVVAPTTPTVDENSQDKVNAKLDETKKKQEEVGNAAVESGEKQKKSLLEVVKEYEKLNAESERLIALDNKSSKNDEMQQFFKKKQEAAKEYSNIQELVTKIQSKITEKTSSSATSLDKTRHLAGIVAYVERLQQLMGKSFTYDVLGENGEEKFKNMKQIVDAATQSVNDNIQKIHELNKTLLNLGAKRDGLLSVATDAEKLEVQLYEIAKTFKANGNAINTTTGKFKDFLDLWKQYKSVGGTRKFSEFTDNTKLISAITKEYKAIEEAKARARNNTADALQRSYSKQYSDIDKIRFNNLINEFKQGTLTAKEFEEEIVRIRESLKTLGKESGIPTTQGQALQTPQPSTKLGVNGEINVVPKVDDPTAFATGVSNQLGSNSAEINITPKIENPADFANKVTEQLKGVYAEISVKPSVSSNNGNDVSNIDEIKDKLKGLVSQIVDLKDQKIQPQLWGDKIELAKEINSISIETRNLTDNFKKALEFYNKLKSSYKTGKQVTYQGALGTEHIVARKDDINYQKKVLAAYMYEMKENDIDYSQFMNKTQLNEVTGTFNKYISSLKVMQSEIDRATKHNENLDVSLNKVKEDLLSVLYVIGKPDIIGLNDSFGIMNKHSMELNGDTIDTLVDKLFKYSKLTEQINQRNNVQGASIPIPLDANIESLNTSIQSKKDQILPVDVKLNGVLSSTSYPISTDNNISTTGMTSEAQQAETLRQKITEVTTAVDDKTNAFRQEEQVVLGTVQREISSLEALDGQLNIILQTIQKIQAVPVVLNVKVSDDFYNSESKVNSVIEELKTSLSGIDSTMLQNLTSVLKALSIKDSTAVNMQKLANAILNLKSNLNNVSVGGTQFLNDIKELTSQADGLKNLIAVIKASKEDIQKAKDEINNSSKNEPKTTEKDKYTILKETLKEVLRLTKEYNKTRNEDTKADISSQIAIYKDRADTLQLELWDSEKINKVEQNRINIIQEQIRLKEQEYENKELANIERQIQAEESLENSLNEQYEILVKDSNEWKNALSLLSLYKNELKDVVKITRNINVDKNTGFQAISYQFTDSNGSFKTVGANGNLLVDNTKVANLNELYKKLKISANEYYSLQTKIINGESSSKVQTDALFAYNNMVEAQKEIAYWKEKGLIPSKEQLQIEEKLASINSTLKEQESKSGLANMYHTILNTLNRLNEKQKEVNELRLKANGTTEFSESIKNAQQDVSLLIGTLRGFKFSDFFTDSAISSLGLNGGSLLFANDDLNSLKWVIDQLPLTENQINKINDALSKNTLIREQNIAAQNKEHHNQQKNSKYNESIMLYYSKLEEAFKNTSIGDAKFLEVSSVKSNGNATIKFIEQIGNQARTTTLFIKDMESALNEVDTGKFNLSNNNYSFGTGKWKTVDNVATPSLKDIDLVTEAYNHLISTEEKYQKLRAKIGNNTASKQQIEDFNVLTALREKDNEVLNQTTVLTEKQMQLQRAYQKEIEKANVTYGVVLTHGGGTRVENIDKAQEEATRINNALTKTQQLMSQLSNSNIKGFDQVFERAKNQVDELNKKLIAGDISNIQTGYEDKINKIASSLKNVAAVSLPGDIETANAKMIELASSINNGKVTIGNFTNNNKVLNASFEQQRGVIKEVSLVYDELSGSIRMVEKGTKKVNTFMQSFTQGLKQRFSSLAQYLLTFVSFYRVWGTIKQGVAYIKEFDTALVEMRKVSDETVKSLKNFQAESFNIAKSVGTTAKQIQESTADFMRLGESLNEASESAQVANVLLNVSEFENIDDATDSLVSMAAAYDELDKIDIVDKLNIIGNNFAISTDGLATALKDSASALTTAGNDMDEAVALATAANRVVQDPNKVGAGLRTIALRITGTEAAKKELEELGESVDDFTVTTASKLNEKVIMLTKTTKEAGVSLLDMNGNYRSTYEIISDIADRWEDIKEEDLKTGENRQNALLEMLAGKNRSNILASMFESPDVLKSAYDTSINESQGSAQEELDKYLDSIEGKMKNFTNEVQEFWYNLISSETVKGFVDFGTKAIDILGKITDKLGLLKTSIIAIIALPKLKNLLVGKDSGGRVKLLKK